VICCRLQDGPCAGIDYHFVAADEPPPDLTMGRMRDDEPWYRLGLRSLIADPDFNPQRYLLADKDPIDYVNDGEPIFAYTHGP
jgi:hypothetical protein